jgi:hypothetical protein
VITGFGHAGLGENVEEEIEVEIDKGRGKEREICKV